MANPTTSTPTTTPQRPTSGIATGSQSSGPPRAGSMGPTPGVTPPQGPDVMPAKPVLFDDLDGVLLYRLYGNEDDPRAAAKAAGQAAYEGSRDVIAAAQVHTEPPPQETGAEPPKETIVWPAGTISYAADQALRERGDPRAAMSGGQPQPGGPSQPPGPAPTPHPQQEPHQPPPAHKPDDKGNDHKPHREA